MGGQTTTTQNTSQQSQTQPWAAAQPQLLGLLANLGRADTGVTPQQSAASGAITSAAGSLPSFAPQITNTANTLLGGGPAYGGILSGAYNNLQGTLAPYLDPARLDPMSTPGFSRALGALGSTITNQVNDQFAAAGRDLSPGNSQALAYGLAQGEAPLIASQYNANVGNQLAAANALFGAGNTTASGLTGLSQTQLGNQLQGASLAGQIPGLLTAPAQAQLAAANTAHGLPLQNLAQYQSLLTPLAQLGSESAGTSQGTTTQSVPPSQQIAGGAIGGLGLLGALAGLPAGGGLMGGGSILGALANLPDSGSASLPAGGSGLPWTYTFQNGRWTPTV
jgi:hypothetical protein